MQTHHHDYAADPYVLQRVTAAGVTAAPPQVHRYKPTPSCPRAGAGSLGRLPGIQQRSEDRAAAFFSSRARLDSRELHWPLAYYAMQASSMIEEYTDKIKDFLERIEAQTQLEEGLQSDAVLSRRRELYFEVHDEGSVSVYEPDQEGEPVVEDLLDEFPFDEDESAAIDEAVAALPPDPCGRCGSVETQWACVVSVFHAAWVAAELDGITSAGIAFHDSSDWFNLIDGCWERKPEGD